MAEHIKLFTPGPGDVNEETLEALAQPLIRHYGPEWMVLYNDTLDLLHRFFQTQNEIYIIPGPASALMDMAIGSLVPTGGKIIVGSNGFFGDRLNDISKAYGLQLVPFTAPLGEQLDPQQLKELLRLHPDASVVALVHHETGTTVLNPLRELAAVTQAAGRVLVVDAVSSLGGVDLPVDDWGIDVCVTAANKCIESVPGIGFISISQRAWQLIDSHPGTGHGWYLNLRVWRQYAQEWGSWHPSPITPPVNVILAARVNLIRILAKGLPAHHQRYLNASRFMRSALRELGFEMFIPAEISAPIVTGVKARPEFAVGEMSQWLVDQRSMAIGGGLGALSGKIFRVGHLGKAAETEYLDGFIQAMQDYLDFKQIPTTASGRQPRHGG